MPNPYSFFALNLLHQHTVTLTNAEIKAGPTTYPRVVPAPGVGRVVEFLQAAVTAYTRTAYTNLDATNGTIRFFVGAGGDLVSTFHLTAYVLGSAYPTGVQALFAPLIKIYQSLPSEMQHRSWGSVIALADIENKPLTIELNNSASGNYTGGHADNTMVITTLYSVYDLNLKQFI